MELSNEELDEFEIVNFFDTADYQEYWIEQIGRSDWAASKFLVELLKENRFFEVLGEDSKLFLLTDGESLISFCTLSAKDDIPDTELSPWIGFVYTKEQYRNNGCMKKLITFVEAEAKKQGVKKIYISTNLEGFYEKLGYKFSSTAKDINGEDSRIYCKKIGGFLFF